MHPRQLTHIMVLFEVNTPLAQISLGMYFGIDRSSSDVCARKKRDRREPRRSTMPNLIGAAKLEDLFHQVALLELDKNDLRRLNEFLNQKLHDLLLMENVIGIYNQLL